MKRTNTYLIVVTGRPAAGKSTLAIKLSKDLKIPVVSKDSTREVLFDQLGWKDRQWAQQLGLASIDLMFHFAEVLLSSSHSIIMDNAFHPELTSPRILNLQSRTNAEIVQVICNADSKTLLKRFIARAKNENRHPGHGDAVV